MKTKYNYLKPEIEIVEMETLNLLAASGDEEVSVGGGTTVGPGVGGRSKKFWGNED